MAVRRARRARLRLVVRAVGSDQPMNEVVPRPRRRSAESGAAEAGGLMLAADRKERIGRLSLVGPAPAMPELLPVPARGAGSFDESGLRVVWADVPLEQLASAAQAIHAALMQPSG